MIKHLGRLLLLCLLTISTKAGASPDAEKNARLQEQAERKERVAPLLALSNQECLELIPKTSRGIFWTTCPNCNRRTRKANWNWSPEHPHEITCKDCGTTFPNDHYPEKDFVEVEAPGGKTSRFYYYTETLPPADPLQSQPDKDGLFTHWELAWKKGKPVQKQLPKAWQLSFDTLGAPPDPVIKDLPRASNVLVVGKSEKEALRLKGTLPKVVPTKGAFYLDVEAGADPLSGSSSDFIMTLGRSAVDLRVGNGAVQLRHQDKTPAFRHPMSGGPIVTFRLQINADLKAVTAVWIEGKPVTLPEPVPFSDEAVLGSSPNFSIIATTPFEGRLYVRRVAILSPEPVGTRSRQLFFQSTADYFKKEYLSQRARDLGILYRETGEDRYAERASLILLGFAAVYPGYPYIYDGNWHAKPTTFHAYNDVQTLPGYQPSRWSFWAYMDLSRDLLEAYQALSDWPGWKTAEGQKKAATIEADLFDQQIQDLLRFEETYHNMSVANKWPSLFLAARTLKRPDLFHDTFQHFSRFMEQDFLYDGAWKETSPSYARMSLGGLLKIRNIVNGYSDPPGYRSPTGQRFDQLDLDHYFPELLKTETILMETRLPDGRLIPLNDTWGSQYAANPTDRARTQIASTLAPGLGVAVLGAGKGDDQLHSYLNFTSGTSHKQYDALSIGLFAGGKELLPSIGYTHTRYRVWAKSAMSKNTVVVNGRESQLDPDHSGNRLQLHMDDGSLLRISSANSQSAYPGIAQTYERTLALVGTGAGDAYLIDFFEVQGGEQHDYLLHGSADEDSTASLQKTKLQAFNGSLLNPGALFIPPKTERDNAGGPEGAYGFITHLRQGTASGPDILTISLNNTPRIATRTLLLAEPGDTLYLGDAPSIRQAGGKHFQEDEAVLDQYRAPAFCWRRQGKDLHSQFVAVHQALPQKEPVQSVVRIAANGSLLLRIDRGEAGVDYFFKALTSSFTDETVDTPDGRLSFQGNAGLIRTKEGKVTDVRLIGSGHLKLGDDQSTHKEGEYTGQVLAQARSQGTSSGGYLDVAETIPSTSDYTALRITFPDGTQRAYNVVRIETRNDTGSRIHLKESPGFTLENGRIAITSFPQRKITGDRIRYSLLRWYADTLH